MSEEVTETVETVAGQVKTIVRQGGKPILIGGPETVYCPKRQEEVTEYIYRSTKTGEIELNLPMRQAPAIFKQAKTTITPTKKTGSPQEKSTLTPQRIAELVKLTEMHMLSPGVPPGSGTTSGSLIWNHKKRAWEVS